MAGDFSFSKATLWITAHESAACTWWRGQRVQMQGNGSADQLCCCINSTDSGYTYHSHQLLSKQNEKFRSNHRLTHLLIIQKRTKYWLTFENEGTGGVHKDVINAPVSLWHSLSDIWKGSQEHVIPDDSKTYAVVSRRQHKRGNTHDGVSVFVFAASDFSPLCFSFFF